MHTITFTCEIVTPMFLAGADGSSPELRPPSIKGALRFWWRAMHGDMAVATLRAEEARLFGGGGDHGTRSPVTMTLGKKPAEQKNGEIGIGQGSGIGYLLYSAVFVQERDCFKPGSEFVLSFSSYDSNVLETIVKVFACLVFFGGLGSRSRRGAGSIFVNKVEGNAKEQLSDVIKVFDTKRIVTKEQLKDHIKTKISPFIGKRGAVGSYSALNGAPLYVLDAKKDWKKALEEIGGRFQGIRSGIQSDIGGTPNFGMPIRHKDRHGTMVVGKAYKNEGKWRAKKISDRRASPLIIKVIKTKDQTYFPIALHLQGELLPSGLKIIDKNAQEWSTNGAVCREAPPDDKYIKTKFLDTLTTAIKSVC